MRCKTSKALSCAVLILCCTDVYAADVLRYNPFEQPRMLSDSPMTSGKVSRDDMKLRGTVIDGDDSLVNIGGEFYRLNQEVAGYRVVQINRASVTLRRGGNDMVLTLNSDE